VTIIKKGANIMAQENHCPQCGAEMPPDAPEGLCPKCLMKAVQQDNTEVTLDGSHQIEGPGTKIGHYELMELIGEGGMGLVYLAEQKEPVKRRVALKIIKPGMDSRQVIARFEAERQVLALLDHPNIAHVFDAGTTEAGRPYFVMEYVKGMSITRYCDKNKLNIEQRLKLFRQVCEAVQHAHQKGIIHRDIKPSNILVSVQNDEAVPKIIDFGIAKAITQPIIETTFYTRQGELLGTPEYMSPEQVDIAAQDIDTRSDVYALGVLLYVLLTGMLPFDRKSLEKASFEELQRTIREQEPPHPSTRLTSLGQEAKRIAESRDTQVVTLARRLQRELEWIPMKAMRKDRTRRYQSVSELADDVRNYLNGLPLIAGPETAVYRARKFVRKHAGSVTMVALIVVAVVIGLVVSIVMGCRAEQARQQEMSARMEAEQAQKAAQEQRKVAEDNAAEYRNLSYIHGIALADMKYRERNLHSARKLLESCPEGLRGWEWYRLNFILDKALIISGESFDTAWVLAMSPDGDRIASGYGTSMIKIWDGATGAEIMNLRGHNSPIYTVAFSPDGKRIVSGGEDRTVKIWDAASGEELMTLEGHESWIKCVGFTPDGGRIVSGSDEFTGSTMTSGNLQTATVKVWDASSGEELMTIQGVGERIDKVAVSPDGKRILTGHARSKAFEWDASTGKKLRTFSMPGHKILPVNYSPDGKRIALGCENGTMKILDAETGEGILAGGRHNDGITSITFSPDSKLIASVSRDNTIKLWDAAGGEELATLASYVWNFVDIAFSPDGKPIVCASIPGMNKIWDPKTDRESTILEGHEQLVRDLVFSPDGKRLVSAGKDKTIKLWDVSQANEIRTFRGHEGTIMSVAISPDGKRIVSGSIDKTLRIWDVETGKEVMILSGHKDKVISVAFSPDGKWIVSGSHDSTVKIWDASTGRESMTFSGHKGRVCSVAFSPDGRQVVSGAWDGEVKVWDASTGVELTTLSGHDDFASSVLFTSDGRRVISGSYDHTIRIWNAATGGELMTLFGHNGTIEAIATSPNGKRIVSASSDRTAKVWDAETGAELMTIPADKGVSGIAFSPDGKTIAGACGPQEGDISLWEPGPISESLQKVLDSRRLHVDAQRVVNKLHEEYGLYSEVIERLKGDVTLNDSLREAALQIANSWQWLDAKKLLWEGMKVVILPGREIDAYRSALLKIEKAKELNPNDPLFPTILGVAQYRAGSYEDALKTLAQSEKARKGSAHEVAQAAFTAMAFHKLNRHEEAKTSLDHLRDLCKDKQVAEIKEAQALLAEAERLLSGENGR
jgi:WD40 repeat protein/serine/threonine protein kinase